MPGSNPHLLYTCLLNQYAQKMRKSPPNYETRNLGFDHQPNFRSTVTFDGVTYTSPNTFLNIQMAEMDVAKIAYSGVIQRSKNEALGHILQDQSICKSSLNEYSAKMNLEKPKYVTSQHGGPIPVFRSQLSFNGATYQGGNAKSKKEAEQSAARAVILHYLDSEFGKEMAEVINKKFRHVSIISRFQNVNNGTNVAQVPPTGPTATVVTQPWFPQVPTGSTATTVLTQPWFPQVPTGLTAPATPVVNQACNGQVLTEPTRVAPPVVTQPRVVEPVTPVSAPVVVTQPQIEKIVTTEPPLTPVVTQPLTPTVVTKPIKPAAAAPVVTQPRIPAVVTKPINPAAAPPVVTQPRIPKTEPVTSTATTVVGQLRVPKLEPITPPTAATVVRHPCISKILPESASKTVIPGVSQQQQQPQEAEIRPGIRRRAVLTTASSAQQHSGVAVSGKSSGQLGSNLSTYERYVEHKRLPLQTPGRKRPWEENKDAQKKTHVDTQRPVPEMNASQAQPSRPQSARRNGNNSRMADKNASRR